MTSPTHEVENRTGAVQAPVAREPYRNPSYPQRDHFSERSRFDAELKKSEERVDAARRTLEAGGELAGKAEAVRTYHQLLGVRDQIAECTRRMPLETGELYADDKERFEQAIAARDRVWQRWEKTIG